MTFRITASLSLLLLAGAHGSTLRADGGTPLSAAQLDSIAAAWESRLQEMEEVVVVGYGTQRRTHLTGAVTKVNAEVFDQNRTTTVDAALGGAVAGLNVVTSGQPGGSAQFRLRRGNSVNASNQPLYVIDGFIYYHEAGSMQAGVGAIESTLDPLSFINPSDIESIEVLKDDGATAIYGSRGANGVIIITTKKGTRGKNNVRYSGSLTVSRRARKLDLLNAREWATVSKSAWGNRGGYTDEEIAAMGEGTDWQDAVLRTAVSQRHEVSFDGGDERTRYLLSAGYTGEDGIVIGSDFRRYNLRANVERKLSDVFQLAVVTTVGKSVQHALSTTEPVNYKSSPFSGGITNSLTYALFMPPVVPVYNADGSYNYTNPFENNYFALADRAVNPVSDLRQSTAESINNYALLNGSLTAHITEGLVARLAVGADISNLSQNYFAPSTSALGINEHGVGSIGHRQHESLQGEFTLTYSRQVGERHYFDALAGYTYQRTETSHNTTTTSHFTNETLGVWNLGDGSQVYTPRSGHSKSDLNSIIARVNYTLAERYNATVTFRGDRSSRFAASHRWGFFPSVGLSWNIDRERFIPQGSAISTLKLRASRGVVGNQEIGDYEYSTAYRAGSYGGSTSYTRGNLGNDNLKWETTRQWNVGLDLGLWRNRLNVVIDLYAKKTSDLLLYVPVQSSTGATSQLQNVGNVTNRGAELTVSATLLHRRQLTWTASANISTNRNRLSSMGGTITQLTSGDNGEYILREGEAVGSFFGLIFDGVDPATGDVIFRDVSGTDGVPDGRINSLDRVVLGNPFPDFFYGLQSSLKWRQWDASISFKGSQGNKAYNSLRRALERGQGSYNVPRSLLDAWTPTNTSTDIPRLSGATLTSYIDSRYVEDASYLKLQHLTLGYTFRIPRIISSIRAYAQGQNLLTFTRYKGYDPELTEGRDIGAYPTARSIVFGLDINF